MTNINQYKQRDTIPFMGQFELKKLQKENYFILSPLYISIGSPFHNHFPCQANSIIF